MKKEIEAGNKKITKIKAEAEADEESAKAENESFKLLKSQREALLDSLDRVQKIMNDRSVLCILLGIALFGLACEDQSSNRSTLSSANDRALSDMMLNVRDSAVGDQAQMNDLSHSNHQVDQALDQNDYDRYDNPHQTK